MIEKSEPAILTDVFGADDVPAASRFNKGARTIEEVREATDARRNATPGKYRDTGPKK